MCLFIYIYRVIFENIYIYTYIYIYIHTHIESYFLIDIYIYIYIYHLIMKASVCTGAARRAQQALPHAGLQVSRQEPSFSTRTQGDEVGVYRGFMV